MIDENNVPEIDSTETVTRFILQNAHFRPSDNTVKPTLFLPYSRTELSVNRLRDATLEETWHVGRGIAETRQATFYGRADLQASHCTLGSLNLVQDPIPGNANHANIIGFPPRKEDQKSLALQLASFASHRIAPPG